MKQTIVLLVLILSVVGVVSTALAEGLNPQGENPHRDNPRKRITEEQKRMAWEAKKQKMEEIRRLREAERRRANPFTSVTSASTGQ